MAFQYPVGTYPVQPMTTIGAYPVAFSTAGAPVATTFTAAPVATTIPIAATSTAPTFTIPLQSYPIHNYPVIPIASTPVVAVQETPLVPAQPVAKAVRPAAQRVSDKGHLLSGYTRPKSRVPKHLRDDVPRPRAPSPHVVVPRFYPLNPLPKLL